jgi:Beta-propeller repeat
MTWLPRRNSTRIAWLGLLLFPACGLVALVPNAVGQTRGYTKLPVAGVALGSDRARVAVDPSGNAYIAAQILPSGFVSSSILVDKFNPSGGEVSPFPITFADSGFLDIVPTGIAADPQGNAYVTGYTKDSSLNTAGGAAFTLLPLPACSFSTLACYPNAFVFRINGATGSIDYFAYLGPMYSLNGFLPLGPAIAVDRAGNAYVTGTAGPGFPTTPGAATFGGGNSDAFVVKLDPSGAEVYATYLGGSNDDTGASIAVDDAGDAYVTGSTYSSNFPVPLATVLQPTCPQCRAPDAAFLAGSRFGDPGYATAFVTKLNPSGGLTYSTYLSGRFGSGIAVQAIAVDAGGNAYLAGGPNDEFSTNAGVPNGVSKLSADASRLVYSTFLPGVDTFYPGIPAIGCCAEFNSSIAVNAAGEAWVTGNYLDGFGLFAKLNAAGSMWVYGSADPAPPVLCVSGCMDQGEQDNGIALDPLGNVYVIGTLSVPGSSGQPQKTFLLQILDVNTPVGTNPPSVVIHPVDTTTGLSPVTLTFLGSVTQAGTTTLTTSTVGPTPPAGFQLGIPPTYYNLTTTAQFTGNITICITSPAVTSSSKLWHFGSSGPVDVTSLPVSPPTICGMVSSLSPFAILQPVSSPPFVSIGPSPQSPYVLAKDSNGNYIATITVVNHGNISVDTLTLTGATLGTTPLSGFTGSATIHNLAPGQTAQFTINFQKSAGADNAVVPLKLQGTYGAGTTTGNWTLSFRGVKLP